MKKLVVISVLSLIAIGCFYFVFCWYNDINHVAVVWDFVSGDLHLDENHSFGFNWRPWVLVARIDTRPVRVCITSSSRAFNCKLVQFEPKEWREFVRIEGFRYYWFANRISFNWGHEETYRGMRDILRGYAFSAQKYPFIKVLRDY